jgi:hypothetical protein
LRSRWLSWSATWQESGFPVDVLRGPAGEVVNLFYFEGGRSLRFGRIAFLSLNLAWGADTFSDWGLFGTLLA